MIRINLLPKEERSRRRSLPTVRIPKIGGMVPFAVLGVVFGLVGTIATTQSQQVRRLKADIESARAEPFPALVEGKVQISERLLDTAPFVSRGEYVEGCLTRIATDPLLNVTAGGGSTVPTFVIEAR